jgi:RNA polymerase sigma-70 factor (ECF subfamily)
MLEISPNGRCVGEPDTLTIRDLVFLDDESVMARLQTGCGDALTILFDRYQRLVYHVALKILRNAADAEDVVQNVFLEIYRIARQFDPARGKARTWILQYAYHRSMDMRQQLQRHYNGMMGANVQQLFVLSPNATVQSFDDKRLVTEALEIVTPVQRRVLELACFEGLSFREIGELVGESTGNARNHYYRGLCKLRIYLTDPGQPARECCNETAHATVRARAGAL